MKLPFTIEEFLNVFENYNLSVYPLQIVFYLIGLSCIFLLFRPNKNSSKIIIASLSFFWLWIGIVYHIIFFSTINKAAYIFGTLFILQGMLFVFYGVAKGNITLAYRKNIFNYIGIIFILYALIFYPFLGYFLGHHYPKAPTFGLPCPTTIFTFGILLFTDKKIPQLVLVIPLLWSIIGFGAALNLSIYEDYGLVISGIIGYILLQVSNKKYLKYSRYK